MLNFSSSNKSNFYLSGLLSLFIYIFVFVLFILYIDSSNAKIYDSSKKVTVLELDIVLSDIQNKELSSKTIKPKEEKVVEKSASKSAEQKANLKSLFANVDTKAVETVKQEVNNVQSSSTSSRFKSKFERESKNSKEVDVSKILEDVEAKQRKLSISTSSKYENDPYYSKVHEILAQRWNPILIEDGLEAKILVIIYSNGEFDYRVLKYSTNEKFDTLLKEFLDEQKTLLYPPHDKGSKTNIEVTFKSKG